MKISFKSILLISKFDCCSFCEFDWVLYGKTVEGCTLKVRLCIGSREVSLMPMAVAASVIWPGPSHKWVGNIRGERRQKYLQSRGRNTYRPVKKYLQSCGRNTYRAEAEIHREPQRKISLLRHLSSERPVPPPESPHWQPLGWGGTTWWQISRGANQFCFQE